MKNINKIEFGAVRCILIIELSKFLELDREQIRKTYIFYNMKIIREITVCV